MKIISSVLCVLIFALLLTACTPQDVGEMSGKPIVYPMEDSQNTSSNSQNTPPIFNITPNITPPNSSFNPSESPENRLQDALNAIKASLPTKDAFIAYSPEKSPSGTTHVRAIASTDEITEQLDFYVFDNPDAYAAAAEGVEETARLDDVRALLIQRANTYPVIHPETVGCVLFQGYIIWR